MKDTPKFIPFMSQEEISDKVSTIMVSHTISFVVKIIILLGIYLVIIK